MPGEMMHIDIKKLGRFSQIGCRITGDRAWAGSSSMSASIDYLNERFTACGRKKGGRVSARPRW